MNEIQRSCDICDEIKPCIHKKSSNHYFDIDICKECLREMLKEKEQ